MWCVSVGVGVGREVVVAGGVHAGRKGALVPVGRGLAVGNRAEELSS
jgi:hypothetical protein